MRQTVRSLVAADAPAVAELEHEARTALRDQRGGPAHLAERPAVGEWVALLTMPGQLVWVATIDDSPAQIHKANVMFRAVHVPAGKHRVRFEFTPLSGALAELRGRAWNER